MYLSFTDLKTKVQFNLSFYSSVTVSKTLTTDTSVSKKEPEIIT